MNDNTPELLVIFIFFGWIPIISICKGISMIIEAVKSNRAVDNRKNILNNPKKR